MLKSMIPGRMTDRPQIGTIAHTLSAIRTPSGDPYHKVAGAYATPIKFGVLVLLQSTRAGSDRTISQTRI